MVTVTDRDYFTDLSVLRDPYSYFEDLRVHGPVHQLESRDVVVVTGFQEAVDVLLDSENFSNFQTVVPDRPLPFEPQGSDITDQIEANRGAEPMLELMVTYDGAPHVAARSLVRSLFIPSRLRANEEYMAALAERMVADVVAKGGCDMVNDIATPYVTLVIADLLGVPEEDREKFREVIDQGPPPGNMNAEEAAERANQPLIFMGGFFMNYITDRRANPREDVLSELATATYPDGSTPDIVEVVKSAMFLFAAGQDTSAKLLGNAIRFLCDDPGLQARLRADTSLVPAFLEEALRLEGSTKATFRLAKRDTKIGDMAIPAGKRVIVALSAANRDPMRWENPQAFELGRAKIKEHLAFGRGAHTCIGAPLARAEVRVILEKFLQQTKDIRLSRDVYGDDGSAALVYEPSYIIRGLETLHVEFDPA
ncbi:cytochrome P450 [Stakelama tenebrarum]|uniref:Cytochrome P450 n=1 Tax=Stakelama tenebrarum TaxID=2711215 RepID=A0A6G6Y2Z2_9SPHN|nr:cytochrome P450 [Sphingosinithalassobacter tenebrarum]QIG79269.1 cytochrome P450 [Sphingosinithalassobacter tenebrarum]